MNLFIASGRIWKQPESKAVGATTVLNFAIINEQGKTKEGQPKTHFFACEVWGPNIKDASRFNQGDEVVVQGSMLQNSWKDADGKNQSMFKVRVSSIAHKPVALELTPEGGAVSQAVPQVAPQAPAQQPAPQAVPQQVAPAAPAPAQQAVAAPVAAPQQAPQAAPTVPQESFDNIPF